MGLTGLRLRSLLYHWRGNLAVLLGVVVGTAVLTGALLVGDSLRGSLRDLTLRRLGWVDQALVGPKFFRAAVADGLPADRVAPAILLQATVKGKGTSLRRVSLMGVDSRFVVDSAKAGFLASDAKKVLLSPNLLDELGVKVGGKVTFSVQRAAEVPRESLLGQRADPFDKLELEVEGVLGDELAARFSLNPSPEAPRNAIVPLATLQDFLKQPGKANALLVGGPGAGLAEDFQKALTLDDWGLTLTTPRQRADVLFDRYGKGLDELPGSQWTKFAKTYGWGVFDPQREQKNLPTSQPLLRSRLEKYFENRHGYLSLESRQLILAPEVAKAALTAARDTGLEAAPTLVYLTKMDAGGEHIAGIVAAVEPGLQPPLGPFLPGNMADDQIVIIRLPEKQKPTIPDMLPNLPQDSVVTLRFKPAEHQPGLLPERVRAFRVVASLPLTGADDDPDLTPSFPGITDKEEEENWELPFENPNDKEWLTKIQREYGDLYWSEYRTSPKAYITLAAGKEMWHSRFGDLTSIRLAPRPKETPEQAQDRFTRAILGRLDPVAGGLTFQKIKEDALKASSAGTDFSSLFLGFSFFLIAAALLLVALLFRLNLDRRASEVGLLVAVGYRRRAVWWLLLGEGAFLALAGVLVGLGAALAYTVLLLRFLAAVWPGGTLQSFLKPHFEDSGLSLTIGALSSLLVGILSMAWALLGLGRVAPSSLLKGQTSNEGLAGPQKGGRWSWILAVSALFLAPLVMSLAAVLPGSEAQAGSFFGSGALLLTAALAGLSGWLRGARHGVVEGGGWWAVGRLGVRNAARHPGRSMLTAGLLAAAAFLIVAVESFRRHASVENGPDAPDGGFALLAESDLSIVDPEGVLHRHFAAAPDDGATLRQHKADARALLAEAKLMSFRVRAGDDASCLNLYQPRRPRILGVPDVLIERGGFRFASAPPGANPWQALKKEGKDIPAFGEQNTVLWQLKKDIGGSLEMPDARGVQQTLRIDGLLQDSVFQSGLLISEERYKQLYPADEGYQFFLVQTPPGRERAVKELLEQAFADRGIEVTLTAQRLEAYLAVENTYLTTFQALGGLGLVLGSLGLAIVLLRGVWERRGELALLRALGWRRTALGWLILAENGFLLLVGLAAGTMAALLSVMPHLAGSGGSLPWRGLLGLFGMVLLIGLGAGAAAVWSTLRAPLVMALRRE